MITEVENVNLFLATNKMAAKSQSKVSGKSSKTPLSTNNTSKTDPKGKKSVTIADVRSERESFFQYICKIVIGMIQFYELAYSIFM